MRITALRTKVYEWTGPTVGSEMKLSTNPMDLFEEAGGAHRNTLGSFVFHAWLVVEVETEDGIVGLGNAALSPFVSQKVIDLHLRNIVVGANLLDIEQLWHRMYRKTIAFGRKGTVLGAISAVDIALWDALGKVLGQPVYRLLGGATRDRIQVYASKLYNQPADSLEAEARGYREAGYKAVKMRLGYGPRDGAEGMRRNVESVARVREVLGEDIDLMAEVYMGWTLTYARRMLPMLAPFNLRWVEEPVIADDIESYAALNALGCAPISGGEHEHTLAGFRTLVERRAVDVLQFDTNRVGGITQARKIAVLAEAFGLEVIPHAGQMHNYHIVMASYAAPMAEFFPMHPVEVGNELFWYIFDGEPVAENGFITLDPDIPGLGLTLSDRYLDSFRITETG
ncbi:L-rhamnonate dehydratase [Fluviibacterium sp. DFM31]|uniref:L-rhamnonate dehydratase n=1 Tax=Meridianimarinicoccus marinus TaxID=3231483 RepID=A0ABV3L8B8_9RHOB